tara:strand:- start:1061 stop:1618 length:558 start_codon:yes stop_codon:yes gene_type:complete
VGSFFCCIFDLNKTKVMADTIKTLIELLKKYPETMEVTNEQNLPFIHMVNRQGDILTLSTRQPIGNCRKCGDYAYKEVLLDYTGVCTTCDENLYAFEIEPLLPTESEEEEAHFKDIVLALIGDNSLTNQIPDYPPYLEFDDEVHRVLIFDCKSVQRDEAGHDTEIYRNHIYIDKKEFYYVLDKLG